MQPLEAAGQLGRLVKEDVVPGRDDEHRRQGLQRRVAGQPHRCQRVASLAPGIGLVEGLEQLGIVAIARGILPPRRAGHGVELGHRIDGYHLAHARHRHGRGQCQIAAGTVAAHRHQRRVATPLGRMLLEVGQRLLAVVQRRRKPVGRRQAIVERRHAAVALECQRGTEAGTAVDAAKAPAAAMQVEQQRALAGTGLEGHKQAQVGPHVDRLYALRQHGRLVAALSRALQGRVVASHSRAHGQHLHVLQARLHAGQKRVLLNEHRVLQLGTGHNLPPGAGRRQYHGRHSPTQHCNSIDCHHCQYSSVY